MALSSFLLLVVAGVGTGLVGYLTGLASLVSYPALLSVGLSPVAANVSNTLGLIGVGLGSTARAGREVLRGGVDHPLRQLLLAALGGGLGATLLLVAGEDTFKLIVPWLIVLGSITCLFAPRLRRLSGSAGSPLAYAIGLFLVSIYGGYFGAGAGVIYLALALITTSETFGRSMILKSILLAMANFTAAAVFIAYAPVNWLAALGLGIGCMIGGSLGPIVQNWIPETVLRAVVSLAGLGLALWLWFG